MERKYQIIMRRKEQSLIIVLLTAIVCLFFYQVIIKGFIPLPGDLLVGSYEPYRSYPIDGFPPGGVPNKAQGPDVIRQIYPWKHFVISSWKSWQVPFWNPFNFSGNPLMANFQSASFYPMNILFSFFDFQTGWSILIMLTPLLASYFLYLFLRELALSRTAAIFSGIVFAFSSYMTVWMEYGIIGHTLLWLPLALFLVERLIKKQSIRYAFLLIPVLLISFLSGYIQGYFYSIAVLWCYYLFRSYTSKTLHLRRLILFSITISFPVLLGMYQLLPMLELFRNSTRGNYSLDDFNSLLNPVHYLITTIVPDFFGNPASRNYWFNGTYIERVSSFGFIPFVFAIFALIHARMKKEILFFGAVFIITLILATDLLITRYFYLLPIPVISTTVPTRILCLFVFSGSILAGFGLDLFSQGKHRKRFFVLLAGFVFVMTGLWGVVFFLPEIIGATELAANFSVSKRNMILPTFFLFSLLISAVAFAKLKFIRKYIVISLIALSFLDLFYFFQKITPFSPRAYTFPETGVVSFLQKNAGINRFWGLGSGYIDSNFQIVSNTFSPEGNDPLHVRSYTELLASTKDGTIPQSLPRPDANIAAGFTPSDLSRNYYRQKILNMIGVKYILYQQENRGKVFDEKDYKLVWEDEAYQIYENLYVADRIFLTADYEVIKEERQLLTHMYSNRFDEKTQVLVQEDPKIERRKLLGNTAVILKEYTPNRISLTVSSDNDALLFLSDTYYPGWQAFVDSKPNKILKANYAFRAIAIPKGMHKVTFSYRPESFRIGMLISFFSALFLILCIGVFYKKSQRLYAS